MKAREMRVCMSLVECLFAPESGGCGRCKKIFLTLFSHFAIVFSYWLYHNTANKNIRMAPSPASVPMMLKSTTR